MEVNLFAPRRRRIGRFHNPKLAKFYHRTTNKEE
jgi:hypothetical protein